jgi:heme oxygenase
LSQSPVLSALRAATAERHALLDAGLAIGAPEATIKDYQRHLCMLLAWLEPIEAWLAAFADGPQVPSRTAAIAADLALIDGQCGVADSHAWPADASPAYRWGVCYVVEGSQLGGAVLYQRLAARLAPHPLGYLRGQYQGPGPGWRAFMQALKEAVTTAEDIDQACRGACDAFDRILALR